MCQVCLRNQQHFGVAKDKRLDLLCGYFHPEMNPNDVGNGVVDDGVDDDIWTVMALWWRYCVRFHWNYNWLEG